MSELLRCQFVSCPSLPTTVAAPTPPPPKLNWLSNRRHQYINPNNRTKSYPAISTRIGHRNIRCFSALTPQLKTTLDTVVSSHEVVLFMKGTKEFPQCGFSNTVVQILKCLNAPFETINILENELLRQGLKEYSSWPTFPQLYIDGDFFGGCDITVEAYQSGELQEVVEKAICSRLSKSSTSSACLLTASCIVWLLFHLVI